MTGKVLDTGEHRCFLIFPPEAGIFAAAGTRWQCDDCNAVWMLVKGKGWVQQ
jgi:hypothetical protein